MTRASNLCDGVELTAGSRSEGGKSNSKGEPTVPSYGCRIVNEVIIVSVPHLYITSSYQHGFT
jgi:hypothetical protein